MRWLRNILGAVFGKSRRRCAIQHCWLEAEENLNGHHLCAHHYHEYTFDVGITRKKLNI